MLGDSSQSSGESSEEEQCILTLNEIRKYAKIQQQVDKRIRELEQQSEMADTLGIMIFRVIKHLTDHRI